MLYPGGVAKTDAPIIGVLTQPYAYGSKSSENGDFASEELAESYIPTAHVNFLEQAGARVIPLNYRLS